jgi:hypothetical protein
MATRIRTRRFKMSLVLFTIAAIAAMASFECFEIIHLLEDLDCPCRDGGDVTNCPFCMIFHFLFGESAASFTTPIPFAQGTLFVYEEPFLQSVIMSSNHPARSPPHSV